MKLTKEMIDRRYGRRWWEFWRRDLPKRPSRKEVHESVVRKHEQN